MFSILERNPASHRGVRLCDGVNRREMLRVGGLGACGLTMPSLLKAATDPSVGSPNGSFGRAKRCIVLFLLGGPPQRRVRTGGLFCFPFVFGRPALFGVVAA